MEYICEIKSRQIKVHHEVIYERNYKSKYTVIYAIESMADKIDKILTETSIRKYTRYVLFKNTNSDADAKKRFTT